MTPYHAVLLRRKMVSTTGTLVLLVSLFCAARCRPSNRTFLDQKIVDEIHSYQDVAKQIINFSLNGPGQNQSYDRLATFTDKFGSRISGSKNLEDAIDYMLDTLQKDGLDNVHGETVNVTNWVRNKEYAKLVLPREYDMAITGLGLSIGTGGKELTADAIVVRSFDDLDSHSDNISGKIVVYNQDFVSYPDTAGYRVDGAAKASKYGAVATLIRSVTPQSLYTPHTGVQEYGDARKIPTACLTVEDAEMLDRIQSRGEQIRITLYMEAQTLDPSPSRNTVAEIKGEEHPEQIVLVSGHMDSWDVGQGAMDDGGGAFISWQALSIVRQMGLKPKRTMRMVMWTDEEAGGVGSQQYYQRHKDDADNFSIMFESDMGVFLPYGIRFTGSDKARAMMKEIGSLLSSINSTSVEDGGGETDTGWWQGLGVPLGTLMTHNEKYFWYHHTNADTMTALNQAEMDRCAAVFAVYAYVLADMEEMLPH